MQLDGATVQRPPVPPGPYLVAGLGRAGRAAASALVDLVGADQVSACDDGDRVLAGEEARGLGARGVALYPEAQAPVPVGPRGPGCLVKSPGVPADAAVVRRALAAGVTVIDELELGWRLSTTPIVGVTGTNGKSTVSALLTAIIGSGTVVGNTDFGSPLSAADPADPGPLVCEVSSYQLEGSPEFLPEAAVLTNVRADHLNRHGTLDAYRAAKRRLFVRDGRAVALAVLGADDAVGRELADEVPARGGRVLRFGRSQRADFRLRDCGWAVDRAWMEADTPDGPVRIKHRLPGLHNAENVLAAVALARGLGVAWEPILTRIAATEGVGGRFERIDEGQTFDAIVDFAHTPDAVEAVLGAARVIAAPRGGRLIVVVSVSGNRMSELTEPIGATCARLADHVIPTLGSLRSGSPATTLEPLFEAARSTGAASVEKIADRRLAIRSGLERAQPGDMVLVLGRGARPRLVADLSGIGPAFDDRVVSREELRRLAQRTATTRAYRAVR